MAVRVIAKVWDGYPGGGSELLAMLALADWSDDEGRCWPSMAAISKKTRLSRSQAQRVVHGLIDTDYLRVTGNETGGAPGSTRQYQINLAALTGRMDATGSAGATGRMGAQEGSHGCAERGRMGATQTVIEPSITVSRAAQALSCPVDRIVDAYHQYMPSNPKCKVINAARRGAIKARWNEAAKLDCKPFGYSTVEDGLAAWGSFFATCAQSAFLTGRAEPQPGKPPFIADIDFLMAPSSFAKCLENKYHREAS